MHPRLGRKPLYSPDFDDKSCLMTAACISVVMHSLGFVVPSSPGSIDFSVDSGENVVIRCGLALVASGNWSTPISSFRSLFPLRIS
jgi:hypothetical protein